MRFFTEANALPELNSPLAVNGNFKCVKQHGGSGSCLSCANNPETSEVPDDVQFEMACMGATVAKLSVHFIQRTIWQHQNQKGPLGCTIGTWPHDF
ncbi:hypothetical protein GQ600_7764 [Phytophthora cactorum]|nr:hypothetical protein GQ600_7764 [Phytophthora cactorum]